MRLDELARQLVTASLDGDGNVQITGIQADSRRVQQGDLFLCLPGHTVDGHDYAAAACERGAAALVVQRKLALAVPQIVVKDCRHAMAVFSNYFFGSPSRQLKLIGVTGTNGKTTITYLIERILADSGHRAGVIGTIEMRYGGRSFPMSGTTPEALELQRSLAAMVQAKTDYCVMEVSSHALVQGRVKGCRYRSAIFTNLTQDHLDYHGTMEDYATAKGLLFSRLGNVYSSDEQEQSYAILNADDPASARYAQLSAAEVITYGVDEAADVRARNIRITGKGTSFALETFCGSIEITMRLVGKFNVYNALAATAAVLLEGISLKALARSLAQLPGVPGRVEAVEAGQPFAVIVDYAHTPDGLENVLGAVKEFAVGKILCVFGCGGDRDRTKRPIMGQIAAKYADHLFITSDNPRTEEPERILLDVETGLQSHAVARERYDLIVDRRMAIQKAVEMASPEDVVLIAGKGHETYQIIGRETIDFDDRQVAKEAIRSLLS